MPSYVKSKEFNRKSSDWNLLSTLVTIISCIYNYHLIRYLSNLLKCQPSYNHENQMTSLKWVIGNCESKIFSSKDRNIHKFSLQATFLWDHTVISDECPCTQHTGLCLHRINPRCVSLNLFTIRPKTAHTVRLTLKQVIIFACDSPKTNLQFSSRQAPRYCLHA